MHNSLVLKDKLREFVSENEYSRLEEAKEWTRMKLAEDDKNNSA